MRILVLNGSPRENGNTKKMVSAFKEGAVSSGHQVDVVDVSFLFFIGEDAGHRGLAPCFFAAW